MGFGIAFRQVEDVRDILALETFLRPQNLNYQHYQDWVSKTVEELAAGQRHAWVAVKDGLIVGDIVYKPHETLHGVMELRNMRLHPSVRERGVAKFLVEQAERHARDLGYHAVMGDVRSEREDVLNLFLKDLQYRVELRGDVYGEGYEDIVMMKRLDRREPRLLFRNGILTIERLLTVLKNIRRQIVLLSAKLSRRILSSERPPQE